MSLADGRVKVLILERELKHSEVLLASRQQYSELQDEFIALAKEHSALLDTHIALVKQLKAEKSFWERFGL